MCSLYFTKDLRDSFFFFFNIIQKILLDLFFFFLGEFVVLWKREKNLILFAGDLRISRDDRIKTDGTSLQITSVLPKDSGEYTCQISTNPPIELPHTLDVLCKYTFLIKFSPLSFILF